jgi:hypothetical protein
MFFSILIGMHVFFGTAALCFGTTAIFRLVSGRSFEFWAARFLQYSLGASAAGILISLYHPDPMRLLAALGIYISAPAVLAWRKRDSSAKWVCPFVLTTMAVACIDCLMIIAHLFRLAALLNGTRSDPNRTLLVAGTILVLFFACLSGVSLRFIEHKSNSRLVR